MSLVINGTTILMKISYDLLYQSVLLKTKNILCFFLQMSRQPTNYPKTVMTYLYELDLEAKIGLVFHYLKSKQPDLTVTEKTIEVPENNDVVETISFIDHLRIGDVSLIPAMADGSDISLVYLQQSLSRIEYLLVDLKREFENHQQKWFSRWRKFEIKSYLDGLKLESEILLSRIQISHQLRVG